MQYGNFKEIFQAKAWLGKYLKENPLMLKATKISLAILEKSFRLKHKSWMKKRMDM